MAGIFRVGIVLLVGRGKGGETLAEIAEAIGEGGCPATSATGGGGGLGGGGIVLRWSDLVVVCGLRLRVCVVLVARLVVGLVGRLAVLVLVLSGLLIGGVA